MEREQENLWLVLLLCAKDEKSEALFERALSEAEKYHGKESLPVGNVLGEIARFYRDTNRVAEAEACETKAESILRGFVSGRPEVQEELKRHHARKNSQSGATAGDTTADRQESLDSR